MLLFTLICLIFTVTSNIHLHLKSELQNSLNPLINPLNLYDSPKECQLPSDPNLQHIKRPGGWATEDQRCYSGNWCPYACQSGMYSTQWDASVKCEDPNHCGSTHGGLFCDRDAKLVYPFPDKPLCIPSDDMVEIKNLSNSTISLCQTVYPGSEIMLIATETQPNGPLKKLACLPSDYWMNAGAHFYVNPTSTTKEHCRWGEAGKPFGNWAPYLIGSNRGYQNNLYVRVGINPNFNRLNMGDPGYSIRIECIRGECINAPCKVHGDRNEECIVTIKENAKVSIILG